MYNHMRTHQKVPCSFCWAPIPVNSLTAHIAVCNKTVDKLSFLCDQCPFTSNRKQKRDYHIKSVHMKRQEETKAELLNNSCKICKMKLNTRKQLMDHVAEHSHEHDCGVCGKTFARKFALTRHLNTIHLKKKIESKTGFGFFEEEEVKRPASILECEQCGYKSKKPNHMKRHKETHKLIKVKELKCERCEYTSSL